MHIYCYGWKDHFSHGVMTPATEGGALSNFQPNLLYVEWFVLLWELVESRKNF